MVVRHDTRQGVGAALRTGLTAALHGGAGAVVYLDGDGEIGIISSVTQPFCASCTRARLSPKGQLFTCLFGTEGKDLGGLLRSGASDDEISGVIGGIWKNRMDRYSEIRASLTGPAGRKVEMYQIGG